MSKSNKKPKIGIIYSNEGNNSRESFDLAQYFAALLSTTGSCSIAVMNIYLYPTVIFAFIRIRRNSISFLSERWSSSSPRPRKSDSVPSADNNEIEGCACTISFTILFQILIISCIADVGHQHMPLGRNKRLSYAYCHRFLSWHFSMCISAYWLLER